jgi:hypothetical protein
MGFYLPVKWVKQLDNSNISCYLAHDSLQDTPHVMPIYTSPLSYHQMIHQLNLFHDGSAESSLGCMPNSYKWLNVHEKWMIGASLLTSSITASMMKNTRKFMQKFTGSSWMPLLLSKIVPCLSKGSRHPGALKVSLTSKG